MGNVMLIKHWMIACVYVWRFLTVSSQIHSLCPDTGLQDVHICVWLVRGNLIEKCCVFVSFFIQITFVILSTIFLSVFRVYVDGPFGSPSEEVFNYDVSLCVAGGIGVTPFACVLHALLWVWSCTCLSPFSLLYIIYQKCDMLTNIEYVFCFVPPVMTGQVSGCRGCTLCGSAGSSSPSTGLLSCCVPCIIRSAPRILLLMKTK